MKKILYTSISAIFFIGMALSACSNNVGKESAPIAPDQNPAGQHTAPKKENVLRMNSMSEPLTLHPGQATDMTSLTLLKAVMEGLTRVSPDGTPQKAIAKDIRVSDDKKTYTFTLRDAKWSNGDQITAADFEYAWKWVLNPKHEAKYAYQLYPILNAEKAKNGLIPLDQVGIKVTGPKTLEVTLANPTPYFLELTAFPTYYPVDQKVVEKKPDWHFDAESFVGNGPFHIKVWKHGSLIVLEKSPDYWDAETVKLEKIEMSIMKDTTTELKKFQNKELDWAGAPLSEIPKESITKWKQEGKLATFPISGTYIYKFNTKKPPFTNAKIRKAFSYAIDRKSLLENIDKNSQTPAMAFVPPTIFKENEKGYFPDSNLSEAKKLLTEGMKELNLTQLPPIVLSYNTGDVHDKIARGIQEMWKQNLGVEVTLSQTEWKEHLANVRKGNYQIARVTWLGDFNDAVNFLETYTIPDGNNNTFWTNDKYSALIKNSNDESDPAKRREILKDAEKILMDEMPIAPIYFYAMPYLKGDNVKDVFIDGLGNIDFKWAHVE